jgi:hypothetical protein
MSCNKCIFLKPSVSLTFLRIRGGETNFIVSQKGRVTLSSPLFVAVIVPEQPFCRTHVCYVPPLEFDPYSSVVAFQSWNGRQVSR